MAYTELVSEPYGTQQLLDKLNLSINETRLVKKIIATNDDLRCIENKPKNLGRANFLKKEISVLESQLSIIRNRLN